MPVYVCIHVTRRATIIRSQESSRLNDLLERLQSRGAKIIDIKMTMTGEQMKTIVYLIMYEHHERIECGE